MRKILSLVLVLALVLGSFSFAFAATPSDIAGEDCQKAVEKLIGLGIINGYPDGTYKPENVVTRAEMAKIIVISLGLESVAEFANDMSTFTDVEGHWAKKYINVASGKGIIKGYPDGTFKPNAEVTYPEAITMMVRALGYTDEALTGTWPINYLTKANDLGITDDVTVKAAGANRGDVAIMLDVTLTQDLVTVNKDGDIVVVTDDGTILGDPVKLVSKIADEKSYYVTDVKDDVIVADDLSTSEVEDDEIDTLVDMTGYLFAYVNVYENEDGEIVYIDSVDTKVWEGTATETLDESGNVVANSYDVEDADEEVETFELANDTTIRFNGVDVTYGDAVAVLEGAEVKVVYTTDDEGEVDEITGIIANLADKTVIMTESDEIDMEEVEDDLEDENPVDFLGYTLPTVENDDEELELDMDNIIVTGDADELEDIKANDLVYIYAGKNADGDTVKLTFEVVRDSVEGEIEEIILDENKVATDVVVDSDEYELALIAGETLPPVGSEVVLVLDENGDVAGFADVVEDEIAENYALVYNIEDGVTAADIFDEDEAPVAKLLLADGTKVEYELDLDLDIVNVPTTSNIAITVPTLTAGDLIKYEINEDEVITRLEEVTGLTNVTDGEYNEDNMLYNDMYLLDEDTIVFNLDDYSVVEAEELQTPDLTDNGYAGYTAELLLDGDYVKVMILDRTTAAVVDTDVEATYALISSVSEVKIDDTAKYKVRAYVDGDLTTYYTVDTSVTDATYLAPEAFVMFDFDGDEIETVTNFASVAGVEYVEGEVVKVTRNLVKIGTTFYEVSDEAVVYDITDGAAVADFSDVEEEVIVRLINFDTDDSVYDYIIILPE